MWRWPSNNVQNTPPAQIAAPILEQTLIIKEHCQVQGEPIIINIVLWNLSFRGCPLHSKIGCNIFRCHQNKLPEDTLTHQFLETNSVSENGVKLIVTKPRRKLMIVIMTNCKRELKPRTIYTHRALSFLPPENNLCPWTFQMEWYMVLERRELYHHALQGIAHNYLLTFFL